LASRRPWVAAVRSASRLGQNAGSGFGQPSALGQPANPFGAPSFGQPAQPSQPAPSDGFGQPSQLGAKPNPFSSGGTAISASPFGAVGGASSNHTWATCSVILLLVLYNVLIFFYSVILLSCYGSHTNLL
jgi:hypothetical protein